MFFFFPSKNTGVGFNFLLRGIFLDQESNWCLLNWQENSLPLSHQGSPEYISIYRLYSYVIAQVLVLVKYSGSVFILSFSRILLWKFSNLQKKLGSIIIESSFTPHPTAKMINTRYSLLHISLPHCFEDIQDILINSSLETRH